MYSRSSFKRTPIGPIPEEWEVVDVGDFVDIETGKRAKGGGLTDGKVASIGGEHLDNSGNVTWANMKFVPEDFYNSLTQGKVRVGDVLIVKDGATTGKVAFVKALMYPKVAVNEHVFVVRSQSEDKLLNKFLFYLFFSRIGQEQIKRRFHGIIGGIRREELRSLLIPLPPLPEQHKIAEILSTVDEAIQKVDEAIARTERLKRGLMQKLLTKGIGHREFKDTEIGRIPKEWEVAKLGEIIEYEKGKKPKVLFSEKRKGTLPYLNAESLRTGIFTQWAKETGDVTKVSKNDILLIWDGFYCGDSFIGFEGILSSTMIKIKPKPNIYERFLFYFLKMHFKELNYKISGMYLKHVNKFVFDSLKLPLPPLPEQRKIAEILSTVDKKLALERERKKKLERIKQGLMNDLLTGKKRVRV
jgi:type I restriction enzyme S subunit